MMKRILIFLVACLLLTSLFSCRQDGDTIDVPGMPDRYEAVGSSTVRMGEYKGLTVTQKAGESRGDAVWRTVLEGCEITEYSEALLFYYEEQTVAKYKLMAENADMGYNELLDALGMTKKDVKNEAKELTKSDIVGITIIANEGIELTDEEKARLFERYAEKIAEELGKDVEYVKESLRNEVYDTMLRDKMIEFLITQNEFVTEE